MNTDLQTAIEAIRRGDAATGKELLLEILREDPSDDRAWLWMSSVVETDDMRRECLEEALKHNPDNRMARRGLEKLQRNGQQSSKPVDQRVNSFSSLSLESRETIEYLYKRLMIEKNYIVTIPDEFADIPVLNPANFLAPIPVIEVPELLPLQAYFDLIVTRQTSARFDMICLKVCRNKGEPPPVTQAEIVKAGQACLKYSNVVAYGQVMPVLVQVWELYERAFTAEDAQRLKALKRIPGRKKVGIQAYAMDKLANRVVYSTTLLKSGGNSRLINRLLKEQHTFSEEKLLTQLLNSRIEMLPILAGIVIGVALALGLRLAAAALGWRYDLFFDVLVVFLVAPIAVYLPKFKQYAHWQGSLAAAGYGVVLYGLLVLLFNQEPTIWYPILIAIFALWGRFVGVTVDP